MSFDDHLFKISAIGAHSNFADKGFRQKDVRFIAELFTNWLDVFLKPALPKWHNTQAMRFLERLQKEGLAKSKGQGKAKRYRLTRVGLMQLVHELVDVHGFSDIRYVLLTYFFIRTYNSRVIELIQREGSGFSKALQIEVEHLFDHKLFLEKHLEEHSRQIERLKLRIDETQKAGDLAVKLFRQGENLDRIIEQVSSLYPYELENQKPMEELFREIEPGIRLWEITNGNFARSQLLWQSQMQILISHKQILQNLNQSRLAEFRAR